MNKKYYNLLVTDLLVYRMLLYVLLVSCPGTTMQSF